MKLIKVAILFSFFLSSYAYADAYKCAKMVYESGWLKKYEHLGNTWGANTKKHGLLSSSVGSSVEKTTSSFDLGVATGNIMSTLQYSSSWGECSMLEYHITQRIREDFIDQNMPELKKQIALGGGIYVDTVAYLSGCDIKAEASWSRHLQSQTIQLYDAQSAKDFTAQLDKSIKANSELNNLCTPPTV